ncbi:DUF2200 domain-containing protein [Cellulomonas hominis]|uniref:DUF2200 domain-containing protein n=1 Tax=Cellulomonas hominis TaxID=156981 RepID=A0A7Z8K1V1_9CELL|nr:DUF2200 domain-containing protein [Cellulomonas hominis]TKR27249.1 DUF2200 domain-containing protein [Cellulomonas hominis]
MAGPGGAGGAGAAGGHRIFGTPFAAIYPHYVTKVERKGRDVAELGEVLAWLTGYDEAALAAAVADERTLAEFFDRAPRMNPDAELIRGVVCGVRVEEIEDPLMQRIRWMDKLVDELARGKRLATILRS